MSSVSKSLSAIFTIFLFFCLMSKMDFLVHGTLYNYGLEFSYKWAIDYWAIYSTIFVAFSLIICLMYWIGSNRTLMDLRFTIALSATVNILMLGGLQDILFFTLWGGGLPSNDVVWWWTPWIHIFGRWTSQMQVTTTIATLFATLLLWIWIVRMPISRTDLKHTHQ